MNYFYNLKMDTNNELMETFKKLASERLKNKYSNQALVIKTFRDAKLLERHNAETVENILSDYIGGDSLDWERIRCPFYGWHDYLLIDINADDVGLISKVVNIWERLENYPLLDEDSYLEKEYLKACDNWANWYDRKERAKELRNAGDYEALTFSELKAMVKGESLPSGQVYERLTCEI